MKSLLNLFRYIKPYKKWAFLAPLLIIFEVIMEISLPTIMANIINIGIGNNNITFIINNVLLMFFLTIIGIIGGLGSIYYAAKTGESFAADLRKDLFSKIIKLSFFDFNKMKTSKLITILTNDVRIISDVIIMMLRFALRVPIILVGSILISFWLSPKLTMIIFSIIPFIMIVAFFVIRKALPYFTLTQESIDKVNATVRDNLGGIRVVKSYVMEDYEITKFDKVNKNMRDIMIKTYGFFVLVMPVMMLFINTATILVLWFGAIDVKAGNLEIGSVLAITQYLINILSSLILTSVAFIFFTRSLASAKRIKEISSFEENIKEIDNPLEVDKLQGKVEFKNVSFSYEDGTGDLVVQDISFKIEPGMKVAILGTTGSGKTTLAFLLARFYDVSIGEILLDDINIKNYSLKTLRKNIGITFQNSVLFSGTIKSNIKYGNEFIDDKDMIKAAKIAQAHNFIIKKPNGYDEEVEQKGKNFSGGQKQRIALARTILIDPAILILDDITSAIDTKTEQKIRMALKKHLQDKTTFIITQRISTAIGTDVIIVLEDGKINGIGTHEDLIKNNTIYKNIYDSQTKGGVASEK